MVRLIRRALLWLVFGPIALVVVHLLVFKVVDVPLTPLMLIRLVQGEGLDQTWVDIDEMSPHLARAVIAAEDNRFCEHGGIDWTALRTVFDEYQDNGRLRGASTISMQTVKNLYLWPGRSWVRKGFEAGLVQLLEMGWSKRRIMEVYLNIVELGPGIYGAEAAAQHHFGVTARRLKPVQAAALAAILPAPRRRNPARKNRAMGERVQRIRAGIQSLGPLLGCVPSVGAQSPRKRQSAAPQTEADSVPGAAVPSGRHPTHLELENAEGEHEAAPEKPRHRKGKKRRAKRGRRSR